MDEKERIDRIHNLSRAKIILEALSIKRRSDFSSTQTSYDSNGMSYQHNVVLPTEIGIFHADEDRLKTEFLKCIGL